MPPLVRIEQCDNKILGSHRTGSFRLKSSQPQLEPGRDYLSTHILNVTYQTNTIGYYNPRFPALNTYMKQHGIRFIDLSEAQGFDRQTMYYPHDGHLNAAGHQWVAEKLYTWIRSNVSFLAPL